MERQRRGCNGRRPEHSGEADMIRTAREQQEERGPVRPVVAGLVVALMVLSVVFFTAGCSGSLSEARAAEEAGDFATAATLYRDYLAENPDDLDALKQLAGILYVQRNWNEALPVQEKVAALDSNEAQIRIELGFNYLNHQSLPQEAVGVFKEACAIEATAQYLSFLAQAQMVVGDDQAAEASLRSALAADKTYPYSYALLTAVLEEQGRTFEAAELREAAESEGVVFESADYPVSQP